jgi:hypothetical protein
MRKHDNLHINGVWTALADPTRTIQVRNPATGMGL